MADVRVQLRIGGISRLLRSRPVQKLVDDTGKRGAAAAGEGFEYVAKPHRWTSRGYIQTDTARAMRAQAKHAVLEHAVSSMKASS